VSATIFLPIKRWPAEERPREKLLRDGEHRLSNAELLAILLDTGTRGTSSLDLARAILAMHGSLRSVAVAADGSLKKVRGIGPAKLCRIRAAVEIGRRMAEEKSVTRGSAVGSPGDVARMFLPRMRDLKREVFKALFLDSQNRVIRVVEIEEGTVNFASPILREVFQKAIEYFASSIVCVHNHPSGNPGPSSEDKIFTEALAAAGKVLQIAVLDHIIIGSAGYFSFADEGFLRSD
jgi:DNA repair protein RadC